MKILKVRSLIALLAACLMVLGSGLAISVANATEGTKPVAAKVSSFYTHECNSSQWQFVITQVKDEASAPDTISVTWLNQATETVTLSSFTGGTAHYITTSNLESSVVSATMNIYLEWGGEFNLSDGPCDATPPPVDVCDNLPGDQPEGTDCTPPPTDACPDLPGDQPEGTDCTPPPPVDDSCPHLTGSIKTTLSDGSVVNGNIYDNKSDVYVYGDKLGDVTTVYIRVTDPSGSTVLSDVKQVSVTDESFGPVQLPAFSDTPNNGGEYKVAVSTSSDFENNACTKFDNFKVKGDQPPPPPTCVTSSPTYTQTSGSVTVTGATPGTWLSLFNADDSAHQSKIADQQVGEDCAATVTVPPATCEPHTYQWDHTLVQQADTISTDVNGDGIADVTGYIAGDIFTIAGDDSKCENPPPGEAENTYTASANGCDDLLTGEGDATITATFNNIDDASDKPDIVGAKLVDMFGQDYGSKPAVSVPDDSSQNYVFTGQLGGDYTVEFVDGDGNVIYTVDVFVDYCELPPLEEGDATAYGICQAAIVNSNEDAAGTVLYGNFKKLNPDGQKTVAPNGTVKLPTGRHLLDIVVFFDNGRYSRFDNIKVKQYCGHHGHHVPPPPVPHHPGNGTPPPSWVPPTTPVVSVTPATPAAPSAVTAFSDTGVAAPKMVRSFNPLLGGGVLGLMFVAACGFITFGRRKHI